MRKKAGRLPALATAAPLGGQGWLAPRPPVAALGSDYQNPFRAARERSRLQSLTTARALRPPPTQTQLVEVGADYEKKIENLWSAYETKKAEEAELLAKSERILQNLVSFPLVCCRCCPCSRACLHSNSTLQNLLGVVRSFAAHNAAAAAAWCVPHVPHGAPLGCALGCWPALLFC